MTQKYKIIKVDNTSGIWKYCIVLYYIQASWQQFCEILYNDLLKIKPNYKIIWKDVTF